MQETTVIESRRPGQNERQTPPSGNTAELADSVVGRRLAVHQIVIDGVADAAVGAAVGCVALALPRQQRGIAELLAQGAGPLHGRSRVAGGSHNENRGGTLIRCRGRGPNVLVRPVLAVGSAIGEVIAQRGRYLAQLLVLSPH